MCRKEKRNGINFTKFTGYFVLKLKHFNIPSIILTSFAHRENIFFMPENFIITTTNDGYFVLFLFFVEVYFELSFISKDNQKQKLATNFMFNFFFSTQLFFTKIKNKETANVCG